MNGQVTESMKRRQKECSDQINDILKKHNCVLTCSVTFSEYGKPEFMKSVVARPSDDEIKIITAMPSKLVAKA